MVPFIIFNVSEKTYVYSCEQKDSVTYCVYNSKQKLLKI